MPDFLSGFLQEWKLVEKFFSSFVALNQGTEHFHELTRSSLKPTNQYEKPEY